MARKQSAAAETFQEAETNGAEPKRGTKTAAIRDLISQGVTNAKEISDEMARQGLSVSMPVIYTTLKEPKKRGRPKGGRQKAVAATAAAPAKRVASTPSAALTADDLRQLADLTLKAGGVDGVVDLLNVMKRFQ